MRPSTNTLSTNTLSAQALSAKAGACALILAPLLGLASSLALPPLRSGERAQIAAITAASGRWYAFALLGLVFGYLLVPAVFALMRLLGPSRPLWAMLAGWLAQFGILVGIGDAAVELMYWQMGTPRASLTQMAALASRYESATSFIYMIGGLSALAGLTLLGLALWRARAVPAWAAAAIPAATVINIVGLTFDSLPLTIISFALMLAAFARAAVIILRPGPAAQQAPASAGPAPISATRAPSQN
jgi:hypothetical protein